MTTQRDLDREARRLADTLRETGLRIVFAESCTGGLAAATLTRIPGISDFLCGSAVVYQVETKHAWLGISASLLENPGPVSPEVAETMARSVLERTPHADLAVSVTGHLGPNAPASQEGLVFAAAICRLGIEQGDEGSMAVHRWQLPKPESRVSANRLRADRQKEVTLRLLKLAAATVERFSEHL